MPKKKLLVFLSHASEDKIKVRKLFKRLKDDGFDPWMDKDRLLPGQDWELEIEQALRKSDAVLLCLSENSISKESFIQREFKRAMQYQEEKPEGEIFVIPVRLDQCNAPQFIKDRQWVDFPVQYKKLVLALKERKKHLLLKNKLSKVAKLTYSSKRRIVSPDAYSNATIEIGKKRDKMPQMRPDYDIGEPLESRKLTSKNGSIAIAQFYKNGMIACKIDGNKGIETFATYGGIFNRYKKLAKEPWKVLGLPTYDENEAAKSPFLNSKGEQNQGRYSEFENGEVVWYYLGEYGGRTYVIKDPFRRVYDAVGGTGSFLGFPIEEAYKIKGGERCDFEGGAIVSLAKKGTHIVASLLQTNYIDSPFSHGWKQYGGPDNPDCLGLCFDKRLGLAKNFVALNIPWNSTAIRYPATAFDDGELGKLYGKLRQRFCGITIKSLEPNDWIRFYIRVKTNSSNTQYIQFDSHCEKPRTISREEEVDYWHLPMPAQCNNGNLHTLIIDMEQSIQQGFTRKFEWLKGFHFRGHIGIADFMVSDSREAIEAVAINPIVVE